MRRKRYWGVVVLLLLPALKALSQAPVSPKVELFAGAELHYRDIYNPQNEMFRLLGTKRSFSQNETFFFSHPYPALFRLISHF